MSAVISLCAVGVALRAPRAPRVSPTRAAPVMSAREPSIVYDAVDVVESNLKSLQSDVFNSEDEVGRCFDWLSSSFRQTMGPRPVFNKTVRVDTKYSPLVGSRGYEVLSALRIGERRMQVRVRVDSVLDPPVKLGRVGRVPYSVEYNWALTKQDDSGIEYDLGQCMTHKLNKYHGVVVGYDRECKQSDEWCKKNGVDSLARGRAQPFYNVLVDRKDKPGATMTYVAQENVERAPARLIDHPYFSTASFTGEVDAAAGVWKPTTTLREQYPKGLDGCWLVDDVSPERSRDDDADFDA